MERDEHVAAAPEAVLGPGGEPLRQVEVREQRVDHRVPDQHDVLAGDAFGRQVPNRVLRGREQQAREVVCDLAVVLLGHVPVEAAQPRLEVADRDLQLHGCERPGERRVDVARHHHEIRLDPEKVSSSLTRPAVCSAWEPEPTSSITSGSGAGARRRDVVEQHVVVLARVDEVLVDEAALRERGVDGRHLHVVRPRAHDVYDDLAHRPSLWRANSRTTSQVKRVLPTT